MKKTAIKILTVFIVLHALPGWAESLQPPALWMKGASPVKTNPAISVWLRDLEMQKKLRPVTITENPTIISVNPNPANRGQTISINGANFSRMLWFGNSFTVTFQAGSIRVPVIPISTTNSQIFVTVPHLASTGLLQLVSASGGVWAESALPLTINLGPASTGLVRFNNNSQFIMPSLVVNGQEMIPGGFGVPTTGSIDVVAPASQVPFVATIGLGSPSLFTPYFTYTGTVAFVNGQVTTVDIPLITADIALTFGAPSALFIGTFIDSSFNVHVLSLVFYPNGQCDELVDGVLLSRLTYTTTLTTPNSGLIQLSIGGTPTSIDYPYNTLTIPSPSGNIVLTRQ